jgi:endonuclease/exonuclease/phosphatase family metal-dependent hydrolase
MNIIHIIATLIVGLITIMYTLWASMTSDKNTTIIGGAPRVPLKIITFNILSFKAVKYNRNSSKQESLDEYKQRYELVSDKINQQLTDPITNEVIKTNTIVLLQEVTNEFMNIYKTRIPNGFYSRQYGAMAAIISNDIPIADVFVNTNDKLFDDEVDAKNKIPLYMATKLHGFAIKINNRKLIIINAHLNGHPQRAKQRRAVLNDLFDQFGSKNVIIAGDLNDEFILENTFKRTGVKKFNKSISIKTSYSRYDIDFDEQREIIARRDKPIKKRYEELDHVFYTGDIRELNYRAEPEGGLFGLTVPYRDDAKNTPNYEQWPSDHTINVYNFAI